MDLSAYFDSELNEHKEVARATRELNDEFVRLCNIRTEAVERGNKIALFGNGGSAGDAQDLATELVCRYKVNRCAFAASAFTAGTSLITASANDFGYHTVFARQVDALCKRGDVCIGITASGESPNVTEALQAERKMDVTVAALSGKSGGELLSLADPLLILASHTTARIQKMHIMLGQMLCDVLEHRCG